MRRFFGPMGSISRVTIESQALKSNMLDDSPVRVVDVYLPSGHDGHGLPLLVDLAGLRIAMRSSPTTTPVWITGWM